MSLVRKARALIALAGMFLRDLTVASLGVAKIVLSPQIKTRPAIIKVPTDLQKPWAVAMFAYFTSLTPGSTCLHVSEDRKFLYVHLLNTEDAAASIDHFKRIYERWIGELER